MSKILIAFASTHGHTTTIANRIAAVLRAQGHAVDVRGDVAESNPSAIDYDAVIVGASIHAGHHQEEVVRWARGHAVSLNLKPSAFFSVCLTAAEDTDEAHATAHDYLDDFEERTGWTPRLRTTFAGALLYREYNLAMRLVMRVLMKRGGHPTDTRRNYDYTDWDAVETFARACSALPTQVAA
jgi:menaquinone-dependent protoporphyrinogen oxidase